MKKLILSSAGFPEKINSSKSINIPSTVVSKQQFIEESIINSINKYNPKLKVSEIEYAIIKDMFPYLDIEFTKLFGLIVEDIEITQSSRRYYEKKQYFIWETADKIFAREIVTYVIMLDIELGGRNTAISQSVFPVLADLMGIALRGPCFKLTNHPVYMINMYGKEITAATIYIPIAYGIASGIEYIEVFAENKPLKNVPTNIKKFIQKYDDTYNGGATHRTSSYEIDFNNKNIVLKTDKLVVGEYLIYNASKGVYDFKGSSEKFFWMDVLPFVILAQKNSYSIDYQELRLFYDTYKSQFSNRSVKMARFLKFVKFIEKISLRGN